MNNRVYKIVSWVVAVGLFVPAVNAGILATTSNSIPGFQGTRSFSNAFFGSQVNANLDFAAFAPADSGSNTFDDFLSEFGISFVHGVPSDHHVYVYQAEILSPTSPNAESVSVGTNFSGNLSGPSHIPLSAYGNGVGENGDAEPSSSQFAGGTSAFWNFLVETDPGSFEGTLNPLDWTAIMFFSSTDEPTWDSAQVSAGLASGKSVPGEDYPQTGLGGTGVPSPSPEPGTSVLFGLGLLILGMWSRKRRNG